MCQYSVNTASCMGTYTNVGVLPLDEIRQFASTKYILRSSTITNSNDSEVSLKSDVDFPKRAKTSSSITSINSYTSDHFNVLGVTTKEIATRPSTSPILIWELNKAKFDLNHTDIKKKENPHLLAASVKSYIHSDYPHHMIYTWYYTIWCCVYYSCT